MTKPYTVKDLLYACQIEVAKGNANKEIWISNDDEGNGYHGLYYEFTSGKKEIEELDYNKDINNIDNAVILG